MLQEFQMLRELFTMPNYGDIKEYENSDEYKKMMEGISESNLLLYPPNNQMKIYLNQKSVSESFLKFSIGVFKLVLDVLLFLLGFLTAGQCSCACLRGANEKLLKTNGRSTVV